MDANMPPTRAAPSLDPNNDLGWGYDDGDGIQDKDWLRALRVDLSHDGFTIDANGWLHLVRDGREIQSPSQHRHSQAKAAPDVTLHSVAKSFEAKKVKGLKQYAHVVESLRHKVMSEDGLVIDRCVCVCLGTFAGEHPYCPGGESLDQLSLLETVLEVLREKYDIKDVFIQDPVMNTLDIDFLQSRRMTVLSHPEAQNHMTPTTLLFSLGFEWETIEQCFEIAYPAMFIGGDLRKYVECWGGPSAYPDDYSDEDKQEAERDMKEDARKEYERVYKPFEENWESQEFPVADGVLDKIYWKRAPKEYR